MGLNYFNKFKIEILPEAVQLKVIDNFHGFNLFHTYKAIFREVKEKLLMIFLLYKVPNTIEIMIIFYHRFLLRNISFESNCPLRYLKCFTFLNPVLRDAMNEEAEILTEKSYKPNFGRWKILEVNHLSHYFSGWSVEGQHESQY